MKPQRPVCLETMTDAEYERLEREAIIHEPPLAPEDRRKLDAEVVVRSYRR